MKKNLLIAFVIGVLLLALVTGCKQDPDPDPEPKPVTVTKNVTVTFAPFGVNPTVINLNPIYMPTDGWDSNFDVSDIRYIIKDNDPTHDTYWSDKSDISFSRDRSLYNGDIWPARLFTQIFYDSASNKKGEYKFFAGSYAAEYFNRIREDTNNDGVYQSATDQEIFSLPPPNASPLVLQLSKTITK